MKTSTVDVSFVRCVRYELHSKTFGKSESFVFTAAFLNGHVDTVVYGALLSPFHQMLSLAKLLSNTLSGNTLRVGYHLCIRHIVGTVFELYQSLENTYRYFHIIKAKNMYRPSYAA